LSGTDIAAPHADKSERHAKFVGKQDKTLVIVVLLVDPISLYLLGDLVNPIIEWKMLGDHKRGVVLRS